MKRNTDTKPEASHAQPSMIAWHVAERGERSYWNRIGAAWQHEDGEGLTLQLDLLPVAGGRIVLRAPRDDDRQ